MPVTILFTTPNLSRTSSKFPRIYAICRALDRAKFRPVVSVDHTRRLNAEGRRLLEEIDVPVRVLRMSPHRDELGRSLAEMLSTPIALRREGVVIQHSSDYAGTPTEPLLARWGGVRRWIATKTNADLKGLRWRLRLTLADRVIVPALALHQALCAHAPNLAPRLVEIPHGVDIETYRPRVPDAGLRESLGLLPNDLVLGCVAHLGPVKDHASLLRAFSTAEQKKLHLLLIGQTHDRVYADRMRHLAAELDIEERVHWLGLRDDVIQLHALMDGVAITSLAEAGPFAIIEAMASGLPVIGTDVGLMPEAIQPGVNGWLVRRGPNLVPDLARALDEWAADPERRARYGQASRRIAVERYSVERMVQQHIDLYEELLDEIRFEDEKHV